MATFGRQIDEGPSCPICLGLFNLPRQLPCAHSFCQSCLQSYIDSKATEYEKKRYFECPVCRQTSGHFKETKSIGEWASILPADTVLQSMLPTKPKVDRLCDACSSEGNSVIATGFCAVCQEAMCDVCVSVHRKQKVSKTHTILPTEDLLNNMQNVMKFAEGFTCFEHKDEDLKIYCNNHKVACCAICYVENHNTCSNIRILKKELHALLSETNTTQIFEELKRLETHLKNFIDIKETNMKALESQVNGLVDQIREMRKKINIAFDELEMNVMMEGRRIHKEVALKTQEENHQCLSPIHAIKNSQLLIETVEKHGHDLQKFLTAEKLKSQLPLYYSQFKEKYERTDTLTVHVKFTPLLESILSLSSLDVGKLVTMTGSSPSLPGWRKPTKECQVEKVKTFEVNISGKTPWFTGVAILPRDRMMLVDCNNSQCILLNNSHQVMTTYKLTAKPYDVCVVGDEEVAVSVYNQSKIQILSVKDDVVSPVRTITTKYNCLGIAAAGKGEMVVFGHCGNNKKCWSLIRDGSEVSYSDQFDTEYCSYIAVNNSKTQVYVTVYGNYIAVNNSKTQVYVTVRDKRAMHCFSMEGKMQYTYSPDNLKSPLGVAVDRDDNIYVVGYDSHNIHQLSPEGHTLQIITTGVPQCPMAITFDTQRDTFIITNNSEHRKINVYQLK